MSPRDTQFPYRPGPFAFRPPLDSPFVHALARLIVPIFLRSKGIATVEAAPGALEKLRALDGQRAVLTPNHPSFEPVVLYLVSRMLGRKFYYLAAKEVFTHDWLQAFVSQRIGAYSIVRGTNDRESIRMTREILARGERWLVAFPEGQDHYHGDLLLPFQPGVVQLACWALDKLKEEHPAGLPPLYVVPVAVRYHFTRDMLPEIERALRRFEARLKLAPAPALSRYARLLRVGEFVLAANEKAYGVKAAEGDGLDKRLVNVREAMVKKVADSLGVKLPAADLPLRDRLRSLLNAVEQLSVDAKDPSAYSRELREREERRAAELFRELDRVLAFVAASGRYVPERPTQERFLDVVTRLDREVLRQERFYGPRRALLLVGEPIDIAARYSEYLADKRGFVQAVTLELENAVAGLLDSTANLQRPLDLEA